MKSLKYLLCTLLLALALTPASAGDEMAFRFKYEPSVRINVDGKAVANEFCACYVSDLSLGQFGLTDDEIKNDDHCYVIDDAKKIQFYEFKCAPYTTTGSLSFAEVPFYYNERLVVYFPAIDKIYVCPKRTLEEETIKTYTLTGDERNLCEISTIPLKWILVLILGLIFVPLMVFCSSYSLNLLGFEPDKRSKVSIGIVSFLFWMLFSNVIVYFDLLGAVLSFPFFAPAVFLLIFLTQQHLKFEKKTKNKKLLMYALQQFTWMSLFVLVYYIFCHQFWEETIPYCF